MATKLRLKKKAVKAALKTPSLQELMRFSDSSGDEGTDRAKQQLQSTTEHHANLDDNNDSASEGKENYVRAVSDKITTGPAKTGLSQPKDCTNILQAKAVRSIDKHPTAKGGQKLSDTIIASSFATKPQKKPVVVKKGETKCKKRTTLKSGTTNKQGKIKTLFGISLDFSASSDEEGDKPVIELVYVEKKESSVEKITTQHTTSSFPAAQERGGDCEASKVQGAARKVTEMAVAQNRRTEQVKKSDLKGKMSPSHSNKPYDGTLQHPNVSIIRSSTHASWSGSLLVDASPSEESLLPISESTRLDFADMSVAATNSAGSKVQHSKLATNRGHNLESKPSSFIVDDARSPNVEAGQDSSYEQLHVRQKATGASDKPLEDKDGTCSSTVDKEKSNIHRSLTTSALDSSRSSIKTNVTDSSANESQYRTALATPDASSEYEAIDVSVQTSFKFEQPALNTENIEKKLQAVSIQGDKEDGKSLHSAKNGSGELGGPKKTENIATATSAVKAQDLHHLKQGRSVDHEARKLKKNSLPPHLMDTNVSSIPSSRSYSQQQGRRNKLPSDSNYFSETDSRGEENVLVMNSPDLFGENVDEHEVGKQGRRHSSETDVVNNSLENEEVASGQFDDEYEELRPKTEQSHADFDDEGEDQGDNIFDSSGKQNGCGDGVDLERADAKKVSSDASLKCRKDGDNYARPSGVAQSRKPTFDDSSSDDDDDKLEAFFQRLKTPAKPEKKPITQEDLDEFIVDDDDVTDDDGDDDTDDSLPDLNITVEDDLVLPKVQEPKSRRPPREEAASASPDSDADDEQCHDVEESDVDDSEDDVDDDDESDSKLHTPLRKKKPLFFTSQTPRDASPMWYTPATSIKPRSARPAAHSKPANTHLSGAAERRADNSHLWTSYRDKTGNRGASERGRSFTFLQSLSDDVPDHQREAEASRFVSQFKKRREELGLHLFKLFNFTVFENQLPQNLHVVWNKRLLKTAGLCKQKRVGDHYSAAIELSVKVCDTAERVRDTLVHEMCHAAVWVLNKAREGHGSYWKYWARKANRAHPEIPIIRRCHDYSINTKFIYQCVKCGYQIGRHSKSLDTDRKVCSKCRCRFQLLPTTSSRQGSVTATPRTPNPFAMFVKEKYSSVKRPGLAHKDVMDTLSKEFARAKLQF